FSSRRRHTRSKRDWSSDVCSSDLNAFPSSFHPRETAPGDLAVEPGVGEETIRELRRRGHRVRVTGAWSLGRLATVARDPDSGELRAAADARGSQGYAAGR